MMLSKFGIPCLSYAQLFSFQVLYSNNADSRGYANAGTFGLFGKKKGEWNRAILEVDYTMGTLFLQDKDRIILCITQDLQAHEAAKWGVQKGLVGVDKEVMKYGLIQRRAKTTYKKDERFLIVVPGKLLLFKNMNITGKHVRFVTSLYEASTHLYYGQLEVEVIIPESKSLNLLAPTAEELTGWIGAIEKSALFAKGGLCDSKEPGAKVYKGRDPVNTAQENKRFVEKSDYSLKDGRIGDSDDQSQVIFGTHASYNNENGKHERDGNRHILASCWDPVRSGGCREDVQPITSMINSNSQMDNPSLMNLQPTDLECSGEKEQNRPFVLDRKNKQRLIAVTKMQEVPDKVNEPARLAMGYSGDQRVHNTPMIVGYANAQEWQDPGLDQMKGHGMFVRQQGSPGSAFASHNQAGPSGAPAGYSSGSTGPWIYGQSMESSKSGGWSGLQRTIFSPDMSQELSSQEGSSSRVQVTPKSKRHSMRELEKLGYYLSLYRKGLVDSSSQTDWGNTS